MTNVPILFLSKAPLTWKDPERHLNEIGGLTISFLIGSNDVGEVVVPGKRTGPVDDRYLGYGRRTW